tara:strand:+ start:985 stop:2364 length:1380 start_codon:yes stop_codon:yes gene_type:complete
VLGVVSSGAQRRSLHGQWSSRLTFILALSGSAVGLGNIWKFPYIAGVNGGGAFVLVYLICVFGIGLPIMISEILIGRRGRRNPVSTMSFLGEEETGNKHWRIVGLLGVVASFLILSYYSVVAGWALAYVFEAGSGTLVGIDAEGASHKFDGLTGNWFISGLWHTFFIILTVFVVARGVEHGLEKAVRILMPALVFLLFILLGYSMIEGNFSEALIFLFAPKFSDLSSEGILSALGHAFFTLSIGMGAVMAYGAYLSSEASIIKTSIAVVMMDTAIAILAGLVIFPIVFAHGLDPAEGPGLIFQTIPIAFGQLPGGRIIATVFFLLLTFAAWTSGIALMESPVAWLMETTGLERRKTAIFVGMAIWMLGLLSVLSFNELSDFELLWGTFFDSFDYLTANIMLPLGGFAIAIFSGWFMSANSTSDEIDASVDGVYHMWRISTRFIAPVAVLLIFLNAIGIV